MSAAEERDKAMKAANTDFNKSLLLAEKVSDAWYRCQSLAAVARFAPAAEVIRVADKALTAAHLAGDAYKRVAVAAWPVRALVERGKAQDAKRIIVSLLEDAERIEHPVSKMGALFVIWKAVWPLPVALKKPVLHALLTACMAANSWKAGSIMRFVALAVASEDKIQAQRIVNTMRESVYKRQAQKRLDAGEVETVCFFFPPF